MHGMDSPPPPLSHLPAGFGIRALAHLIDSALWLFIVSSITIGVFWRELVEFYQDIIARAQAGELVLDAQPPLPVWFSVIFKYLIPAVVLVWLWKWKAATPGKMILGLRVVDAVTRGRLSVGQCIVRMFGYLIPMAPLLLFALAPASPRPLLMLAAAGLSLPLVWGFFSIFRHPQKQGWHDRMAGTVVVQTKSW